MNLWRFLYLFHVYTSFLVHPENDRALLTSIVFRKFKLVGLNRRRWLVLFSYNVSIKLPTPKIYHFTERNFSKTKHFLQFVPLFTQNKIFDHLKGLFLCDNKPVNEIDGWNVLCLILKWFGKWNAVNNMVHYIHV